MSRLHVEPGVFVLPASVRAGGTLRNVMGREFTRLLHTDEWRGRREDLGRLLNECVDGMFAEHTGQPVVYLVDLRLLTEDSERRILQALPWGGKAGGCPPCMAWLKDKKELTRDPTEDTEPTDI